MNLWVWMVTASLISGTDGSPTNKEQRTLAADTVNLDQSFGASNGTWLEYKAAYPYALEKSSYGSSYYAEVIFSINHFLI